MEALAKNSHIFIDANALMYRFYFGHQNAEQVHPMQAVKSFLALIWKIRKQLEPSLLVIAMDSREATFRQELDTAYKANRESMPEDLAKQFRPLYLALKFMGVKTWVKPGFEADDLLASLSRQIEVKGVLNYVVTLDKDLTQVVNDSTRWVSASDFHVVDASGVRELFGVAPKHISDLLALTGDTIDNIPGVPGVGKKSAADLINRYGSLDGVLSNRNWLKGKIGESLRKNIDRVILNRQLTSLRFDLSIPELNQEHAEPEKLARLCEHYAL